ncbi:MAG: DUF1588 domain-containing protein, partial [Myxococcales bacterium]|nr:DUF1588 domain-containing protein [Myxococcales bacterium]
DGPAPQTVTDEGWFVWELLEGELERDVVRIEVALHASAGGIPAQLDVNHVPTLTGLTLDEGDNLLSVDHTGPAGEWLKVGVNVAPGGDEVRFDRLTLHHGAAAGGADCDPAFRRVELDTEQRTGLLTQGSLLAGYGSPAASSPVKRGKWVRVRMLCQDLPDPPNDVPELPSPLPGVSTRERFAMHTDNPACAGCHTLIDGLGFGFEHYDGIGAFRTMDQGAMVDASGEINQTRDIDGTYEGVPDLAGVLAGSQQVMDCASTQWMRFALARRETPEDACSLMAVREAFDASGGDLRELMVALTQTDAFRYYRRPE